jgi:molybdopterin-containing oxidoreductase family iron-sulfur binding subunit
MNVERTGFDLENARRRAREGGGRQFWMTVEELLDDTAFRQRLREEFSAAAAMIDAPARRQFLKLMGASLLLMGTAGCSDNRSEHALPYVNQPEDLVPGVPRQYATALSFEGYAQPVLATTYDGRPTKLDGNPDHPATRGKSDAFMQAAIFELYDPERSKEPTHNGETTTWGAIAAALAAARTRAQARAGEGLRLVMRRTTSPTLQRQLNAVFREFPAAQLHFSDAVGADERDAATTASFGRPLDVHYALDACDVVVSIDDDLLGPGPQQVRNALAWSTRRGDVAPEARTRLHVAESVPSLTGTVATTRFPSNPSRMMPLLLAIAASLGATSAQPPTVSADEEAWVRQAVADLQRHAGRSLVTAGAHLDPRLQSLAFAINAHLGSVGQTVFYTEPIHAAFDQAKPLRALASDIAAGKVDTLFVLEANPAYDASGALGLRDLIPKVATRIHAGLYQDETASLCEWHLPLAHALESWSDARAVDGTASIIQPVIAPLYSTRNVHQILDMLRGEVDPVADSAVRETWRTTFGDSSDARWRQSLHDGFVGGSEAKPIAVGAGAPAAAGAPAGPSTGGGG